MIIVIVLNIIRVMVIITIIIVAVKCWDGLRFRTIYGLRVRVQGLGLRLIYTGVVMAMAARAAFGTEIRSNFYEWFVQSQPSLGCTGFRV